MSHFADLPLEPLSDSYGLDRGTPLDRRYIEAFLGERKELIRGSVLEVQHDAYTVRFGADRVASSTVIDIDRSNPRASLVADLEQPGSLPPDFTVHAKGNLRSCVGFLLGEVIEEVPNGVLDRDDPRFPLTVAVEAHRM